MVTPPPHLRSLRQRRNGSQVAFSSLLGVSAVAGRVQLSQPFESVRMAVRSLRFQQSAVGKRFVFIRRFFPALRLLR